VRPQQNAHLVLRVLEPVVIEGERVEGDLGMGAEHLEKRAARDYHEVILRLKPKTEPRLVAETPTTWNGLPSSMRVLPMASVSRK
jgi:hypothetical protein